MRTVEDDAGRRYLLLTRSSDSSLVRDIETGERRHVPNARLSEPAGVDPLVAAAETVPAAGRGALRGLHDDRAIGLLVLLAHAPRSVRALLSATDLCESDLLGVASELRAAGLVEAAVVDGERGYAATDPAREALQSARAETSTSPD